MGLDKGHELNDQRVRVTYGAGGEVVKAQNDTLTR